MITSHLMFELHYIIKQLFYDKNILQKACYTTKPFRTVAELDLQLAL